MVNHYCEHPLCPKRQELRRKDKTRIKTPQMRMLERVMKKDIDSIIVDAFIENDGHLTDTAESIGIDYSTLSRWVYRRGLREQVDAIREKFPSPNSRIGGQLRTKRLQERNNYMKLLKNG